jgi:hypothetical protein
MIVAWTIDFPRDRPRRSRQTREFDGPGGLSEPRRLRGRTHPAGGHDTSAAEGTAETRIAETAVRSGEDTPSCFAARFIDRTRSVRRKTERAAYSPEAARSLCTGSGDGEPQRTQRHRPTPVTAPSSPRGRDRIPPPTDRNRPAS